MLISFNNNIERHKKIEYKIINRKIWIKVLIIYFTINNINRIIIHQINLNNKKLIKKYKIYHKILIILI